MNALLAIVGILGVSASGPMMAGMNAPALAIAFWRNAIGTVVIAPYAAYGRRSEIAALTRADRRAIVFAGLMLAGHFGAWVTALKLTSVASATALVSLQVGWVVLFEWLRGTAVSRATVVGLVVSFGGVLVVSGVDVSVSGRALTGDLLALAGGMFSALYMMAGSHVRRTVSTTVYTGLCYGTCAIVMLAGCLLAGQSLVGYGSSTWMAILGVTVCAQFVGHSVFNHLLAVMSPTVVSLALLLEVPGAALLAAFFLDEAAGLGVYAGLVLVLAGLVIVVTKQTSPPMEAPLD